MSECREEQGLFVPEEIESPESSRPRWPPETNGLKLGLGAIDAYTDAPGPASENWRPLARWAACTATSAHSHFVPSRRRRRRRIDLMVRGAASPLMQWFSILYVMVAFHGDKDNSMESICLLVSGLTTLDCFGKLNGWILAQFRMIRCF